MFAELLTKGIKYRELLGDNRIGTNSYPLTFTNCAILIHSCSQIVMDIFHTAYPIEKKNN